MTTNVNNPAYVEAIENPGAIRVISRINEVVLSIDLEYDWERFESGREDIDLKTILLYGPHSKATKVKVSRKGVIMDPGGRYNIIPLGGGIRLRTVSTPRFDGHGRPLGSDPTSWIIPARSPNRVLDSVIDSIKNDLQAIIDIEVLAEM